MRTVPLNRLLAYLFLPHIANPARPYLMSDRRRTDTQPKHLVSNIDAGMSLQQRPDHLGVALVRGAVQRRPAGLSSTAGGDRDACGKGIQQR